MLLMPRIVYVGAPHIVGERLQNRSPVCRFSCIGLRGFLQCASIRRCSAILNDYDEKSPQMYSMAHESETRDDVRVVLPVKVFEVKHTP